MLRRPLFLLSLSLVPLVQGEVDFAHEVMPLLQTHCVECHGGDEAEGGFSMNTRALVLEANVVEPGDPDDSILMELILTDDEDEMMPPPDNGKPALTEKEIDILKRWIKAGVPWVDGFTFAADRYEPPLKPRKVELPPVRDGRDHPIDRLLDAGMAEAKVTPPVAASDSAFLRRATLDVIGLLPTNEELDAFLADDSPDKRKQLIDRLLADDIGYADHWLTAWNDLLRNDYTGTGFITGGRKQITTWLYQSLRENKPYDMFVRELIAPKPEAAGFINGIKWRGDVNASQTRDIQFSQNVSQVFLGINMKCASCHDSFIDRWTLKEAYNLAAIFAESPLELNRCDKPTGEMATPKWIFPELGDVDPKAPKAKRLEQLAGLMTHPENGRFARTLVNRIWERLMGRGIVHPVDAMDTEPWNEDLLDYLAVRFAEDGHDLRKLIAFIMSSEAYQSETVILEAEPGEDYVYTGPIAKRMTAEQLIDSIWQVTKTNPGNGAANVNRIVKAQPLNESQKAFTPEKIEAKWIWHQGETGTKSQMRHRFELTELPEKATLMATCDNAFSLRINGKEAAKSNEWTQPVLRDIRGLLKAGENLIEVNAEMFGGSAGFIGQIDLLSKDGKHTVLASGSTWEARPPKGDWSAPKEIAAHGGTPWGDVLNPHRATSTGGQTAPVRAALVKNDFLMRSLGRPHRDQVVTSRPRELTTLQAIDLANGDILAGYLGTGAQNLVKENKSGGEFVDWLFQHALSRKPTTEERSALAEIVGDGTNPVAVEDSLWMVMMLPEFQIIR